MKINGTIFSKPQQDQLKRGIGAITTTNVPIEQAINITLIFSE